MVHQDFARFYKGLGRAKQHPLGDNDPGGAAFFEKAVDRLDKELDHPDENDGDTAEKTVESESQ